MHANMHANMHTNMHANMNRGFLAAEVDPPPIHWPGLWRSVARRSLMLSAAMLQVWRGRWERYHQTDLQPPGGGLHHGHCLPNANANRRSLQNGGSVFYSLSCRHVEWWNAAAAADEISVHSVLSSCLTLLAPLKQLSCTTIGNLCCHYF